MNIYRLSIILVTVMLALSLSIPALADSYTDTIAIYKKAPAVAHTAMQFSRLSVRADSLSVAHTEKGKYIRVAKSRAKHL